MANNFYYLHFGLIDLLEVPTVVNLGLKQKCRFVHQKVDVIENKKNPIIQTHYGLQLLLAALFTNSPSWGTCFYGRQ